MNGWQHGGVDGASGSGGGDDTKREKQTEKSANERYTHTKRGARRNAIPTIHILFYSRIFSLYPVLWRWSQPTWFYFHFRADSCDFLNGVLYTMLYTSASHTSNALEHSHLTQESVRSTARFSSLSMARSLWVYLLLWPKMLVSNIFAFSEKVSFVAREWYHCKSILLCCFFKFVCAVHFYSLWNFKSHFHRSSLGLQI